MRILVINCGSSTLKYKLYVADRSGMQLLTGRVVETSRAYRESVSNALDTLPFPPEAIAHRVVHGGDRFSDIVCFCL
jgi:acetate kinase